jgi:hypothetical protein
MEPVDALFAKCAWWTLAQADGEPWIIVGLWNDWKTCKLPFATGRNWPRSAIDDIAEI